MKTPINTKVYYCIYCLAFAFDGFLLSFPGAIYVELQNNLNTSVLLISWIYTALSIGYIVANIACGYIADRIEEVHRLQSVLLLACGVSVICVPFTTNIVVVFTLFIIIGIGWAANETLYTLFVFRLYPTDGAKMYFLAKLIMTTFAVITASFIQFSLSMTNTYLYPFVIFGGIAIVHAIAILFIETPKHDEYRAIKRRASSFKVQRTISHTSSTETDSTVDMEIVEMDEEKLAETASSKLKESKSYRRLQNVTIALLLLSMCLFAMQQGGFLAFTTVYCRDYLQIDDKYGRYFISTYWAGNLLVMVLRQLFAPNSGPAIPVVVGGILRFVLQILFVPLSKMPNLNLSFLIMYGLCGVCTGLSVAALCAWAEKIRPTTGLISCLWWVLYGIGTGVITFSMGTLIEQFGAKWIPHIICVPLFLAMVVNSVAVVTYKMIKKQELSTFEEIEKAATMDEDDEEETVITVLREGEIEEQTE
eukprot:CAMPEP_0197024184 /NCGR_PEP_ID=MMETSP1384-20130603/4808_1 /TAXON_ID=29189 /ORGANISM="Ammonia sp." /LENGTH=476 /DNA_ID=CAMNT_0042452529 /DNA_START=33 /DNA_END=1463 /DNA_ORIENTATION=+